MNLPKYLTITILSIILLIGVFYIFNNYIYQEKQANGNIIETYRATLSGEYVCLPHKEISLPMTEECTFGLRTNTGEYYAINFQLMSQEHRPLVVGERISASGVVTPIEMLSSDFWQKYPISGIFSVTDSLLVRGVELSSDRKSISTDGVILLFVDNETIFNWFKTKSQLCDTSNITNTPTRKTFCESKNFFRDKVNFVSISVSPDNMKIGFKIESDELSPDAVVGVFNRKTSQVTMLTNYYLGNEFISFSPRGTNLVYRANCFEAKCGLFIKNSVSLFTVASLNNPNAIDGRTKDATFVRWITDRQIEYKLGEELKQASF